MTKKQQYSVIVTYMGKKESPVTVGAYSPMEAVNRVMKLTGFRTCVNQIGYLGSETNITEGFAGKYELYARVECPYSDGSMHVKYYAAFGLPRRMSTTPAPKGTGLVRKLLLSSSPVD